MLHFNMTDKGIQQLSDAFMYIGKRRNATEANAIFARYKGKFPSQIPWPSAVQRPFVYVKWRCPLLGLCASVRRRRGGEGKRHGVCLAMNMRLCTSCASLFIASAQRASCGCRGDTSAFNVGMPVAAQVFLSQMHEHMCTHMCAICQWGLPANLSFHGPNPHAHDMCTAGTCLSCLAGATGIFLPGLGPTPLARRNWSGCARHKNCRTTSKPSMPNSCASWSRARMQGRNR